MENKSKKLLIGIVVLGALLLIAVIANVFTATTMNKKIEEANLANEQLQLTNEQLQLASEYQSLNTEYAQYENQSQLLANDSLVTKYAAAKSKVEKLLQELNSEKQKSAARIKQLQDEIGTLKNILRHYVAQIDSLGKENANLRAENTEIRQQNQQLSSRVATETKRNEVLSERMTLAEKLNVTGVSLTALKKNGKVEKNVTKAKQLDVSFTIPQNNSTPVGEKTIYLRIVSPEGTLLGGAGSFSFEGGSLQCTARKTIEYSGDEVSGIHMYWDVNTTLNPGDYTVELFADNFRLVSRRFTLSK
jgi:predicted  nucleic acid-binding Zn-ribbon protein